MPASKAPMRFCPSGAASVLPSLDAFEVPILLDASFQLLADADFVADCDRL